MTGCGGYHGEKQARKFSNWINFNLAGWLVLFRRAGAGLAKLDRCAAFLAYDGDRDRRSFLIAAMLTGIPGLAVPAAIIGGIGGLLYWQNQTGNWESWAYAWTLIPGFVGVGIIVSGLLGKQPGKALREGLNVIVVSLILFALFGSFLGGRNIFGPYWPVLLILLGLWLLVRPFWRSQRK